MKYWLLAILLANLALFLVEFRTGLFESAITQDMGSKGPENRMSYSKDAGGAAGSAPLSSPIHLPSENADNKPKTIQETSNHDQPMLQGRIYTPDIKEQTSSSALIPAPGQNGIPAGTDGNAVAGNEKPPVSALPSLPKMQAPNTNESAEKIIETAEATEPLQKDGIPKTEQAARGEDKANKSQNTAKDSSTTEMQPVKNKPVKDAPIANDSTPPRQTSHPQDDVMTACYTAGPIKDAAVLNALLTQFRPQLTELAMSSPSPARKTRKHNAFTVYYPAPSSMEESLTTATLLKTKYGVKDLQVFRDGEMKGAIALGVYSNERNALSAKSQFEQKGLQVQIKPRFPVEGAYKVRMRWTEKQEKTAEQLVDALSETYPDTQRIGSCE